MKLIKKLSILLFASVIIGTTCTPVVANATENSIKSGVIDLNSTSENIKISDVLTYDEIVNEMAKQENISIEQAQVLMGSENLTENRSAIQSRSATYRTYTCQVAVTAAYKPSVVFYCTTSEWGNYHGIINIQRSSLNRASGSTTKQFSGSLYTNLESANTIYFELNGDFFNNGTTVATGGAQIGIGEVSNTVFSISYSSNHYCYVYKADRFNLYN